MQARFTAQADGTYSGHIRTRREPQQVEFAAGCYRGNAILVHLRSAFPGHLIPKPGTNADRKEGRVERSAGAEAVAAAGGAGFHAGAGAEDLQNVSHSVSAGAGPLPARQMSITWPVVGGEGDGDFCIPGRGAGTRRADLGLPAQPLGETATALGTSGPSVRAIAKAYNSKGGAQENIYERRKQRPETRGLGHRSQRRYAQINCRIWRGHGSRGWTALRRRAGDDIGPGGPRSPGHHCGRSSGRHCRRDPRIRRRRRPTFYFRLCPLGARYIPSEAAAPALCLPAQPLGEIATALGTSGPSVRAISKAYNTG